MWDSTVQSLQDGRVQLWSIRRDHRAVAYAEVLTADHWDRPYSREQAGFPASWLREHKFWPAVGRIDNVFGDRNPVCSCLGMDAYPA